MLKCANYSTRCVFSDIIRLNNLIFKFICRFRHLNSNIISFSLGYFSIKILLKSVMSFLEFGCRTKKIVLVCLRKQSN